MHIKNKKNFKILTTVLLGLLLICVYSAFNPFKYPLTKADSVQDDGRIGLITGNAVIKNKYISNAYKLDTITIITATDGKKISQGTLNVKIYNDKNKKIYQNQYSLANIEDNQYLNFEFDVQNDSYNKEYIVQLEVKELGENDELSFRGNADLSNISADGNVQLENSLYFDIHGEFSSYMYTLMLFSIFLIVLFINVYKNIEFIYKKTTLKDIIRYIILMIISFIMSIGLFAIYLTSNYNLSMSPLVCILTMICASFVVINLAIDSQSKKMEKLFLSLAIPLGALFLIFIIPGSAPDESFHFKMVHRLSNLSFETTDYNYPYAGTVEYPTYRLAAKALANGEEVTGFGLYSGIGYTFLLYIIPAIGFKLFSLFSSSVLLSMYGASFFNYLLYILFGYLIVKRMPTFKYLMVIYMLTPLYLQQSTSLSCDAMIFPCCLYFIAHILDIKVNNKDIRLKDMIILSFLSIIAFSAKFAYFPLLLLLVLIRKPLLKYIRAHKKVGIFIIVITVAIMSLLFYTYKIKNYDVPDNNAVYVDKIPTELQNKLSYTLSSINKIPAVAIKTIDVDGSNYVSDFAGTSLKWDEVTLPVVVPIVFYLMLFLSIFMDTDKIKISKKSKILILITFIISAVIVFAGLYTDGANRSLYVEGVQGRYFIPFLVLGLLLFKGDYVKIKFNENQKKLLIISAIIFVNIIALKYLMISYIG